MLGRVGTCRKTLVIVVTALGAAIGAAAVPAAASALQSNCSQSGATVTCTYFSVGSEQTFAVPAGLGHVTITAVGAPGDLGGGNGANVRATVPVKVGTSKLYVEVGGTGSSG
ncbi:MAG TPA: hypothetical protein VFB39_10170, partial [Solirubrobacteraceae bacterium]|nr:hypothetical protein [Solirubrobacteraceae bacterium]